MNERDLIKAAIRSNCGAWWETYGKIWAKDRSQGLVSPKQNYLQRKIQATVDKFDDLGLPCRIIGLKPRARGSTTYFTGLGYTAMRRSSTSAIFIGGQSDQTVGLWNMMKTYFKNDAFDWSNTGEVNEKGAVFSNGSRAKKDTARDVQAGIGDTYQLCHLTEAARWAQYGVANAAMVMNNILKAIPLLANTYIFIESSAENVGSDFYTRFTRAIDAEDFISGEKDIPFGSYARVFASWFQFDESAIRLTQEQKESIQKTLDTDEEYFGEKELIALYSHTDENGVVHLGETVTEFDVWEQLAWRRYAIAEECDRDVKIFDRDYPHSWQTAFMKAGAMRFNSTGVAILSKRKAPIPLRGVIEEVKSRVSFRQTDAVEAKFTIWEKPIPGCRYILPVDPMTGASQAVGLDPDKHSAPVLRAGYWNGQRQWVRPAVVARVVPCRWEIDTLEGSIWNLARFYGPRSGCMIPIEINMDRGLIELLKLRSANLYMREVWNKREEKTTGALGFKTDVNTREALVSTLAKALREWDTPGEGIDVWCPHAIEQIQNFIKKEPSGRSEASQGYHDDDCFIAGTLVRCRRGMIPIENVVIGDMVLTHAGRYMPVTRTVSKRAKYVYEIKSIGRPHLTLTGNHKILTMIARRTWKHWNKTGQCLHFEDTAWRSIDGSSGLTGCATLTAIPIGEVDKREIDMMDFAPHTYRDVNGRLTAFTYGGTRLNSKQNPIPRIIPVDDMFCFLIGYYAAEGGCGKHNVAWASHRREAPIREFIGEYLSSLGLNPRIRNQTGDGFQITVGSVILRSFFKTFGTRRDKHLPAWVSELPRHKQKWILLGYFLGDGCVSCGRLSSLTISHTLGTQIHEMLLRNDIPASIRRSRALTQNPDYSTVIFCSAESTHRFMEWVPERLKSAKIYRHMAIKRNQTVMRIKDGYLVGGVRSVNRIAHDKLTYCIDVEGDHSFHANGIVVHNCIAIALGLELIGHATLYVPESNFFGFGPGHVDQNVPVPGGSAYS